MEPPVDDLPPEARARCFTWPMLQYVNYYDEPTVAQLLAATPSSSNSSQPEKKKRCRRKPADQLAQKKPNPWGEDSYSDLIAKALESAPDGRLKLNEIYQWFSDNVPYFRDRSSQEEAAGWKNSIRHNLSLHSRFMRIQNEGAGKSSWWVINPDAKPGRNPRRQRASTLDTTSKAIIEKKRRGARKKVMEMRSGQSSGVGSTASLSHDWNDEGDIGGAFDYRPRAQSTNVARVSPVDHFDDFDFPPWVDAASNVVSIPSDILDRTDQMRLDPSSPIFRRNTLGGVSRPPVDMKPDLKTIKQEPGVPPPSYQELSSVRGPSQLHNPLLRPQLTGKAPPVALPPYLAGYSAWNANSCGAASTQAGVAPSALPIDLENLTLPDQPLIDMDMETLLRHELSQTNNQLNFDI